MDKTESLLRQFHSISADDVDGMVDIYAQQLREAEWTEVVEGDASTLPRGVEEKDYVTEILEHGTRIRRLYTGAGDDLSYVITQNKDTEMPIIRWRLI